MKKIFKSLLVLVLCVLTCLTFAGCGNTKWSEVTNDVSGVTSNGGITLYHDGWVYFVNGIKENSESNLKGKIVQSGIYRAKADQDGNILYKETPSTQAEDDDKEEKEEVKEFEKIEPVVKSLVGFKDGSIYIFGDYLYYATPCTSKNKKGEMLNKKTEFHRYDLVNGGDQVIYTTQASDDTISYTYYKSSTSLYFVVYEKNSATLTSFEIGKNIKKMFKEEEVKSAVFSEKNAQEIDSKLDLADHYVYFTLEADKESEHTEGVRVYQVKPDGTKKRLISEGETITLLSVKGGKLVYSDEDNYVYAESIVEDMTLAPNFETNVIMANKYDNFVILEETDGLAVVVYDKTTIRKLKYVDGTLAEDVQVKTFDSSDKVTFIGVDGEYVIYQLSNLVYKIKYNEESAAETKLSTTKIEAADGLMASEIMNGYVYGFYKDTKASVTYLYRINLLTPEERGETDKEGAPKEVGEAEFLGIKQ